MTRLLYWYPITLSAIGVGIHFFGTLGMFQLEVPRAIHGPMLAIDSFVVLGLLTRSLLGYWLAILLYGEQSIMQPFWTYESFVEGHGSLFQLILTSPLVIAALLVLIFNKQLFIKRQCS